MTERRSDLLGAGLSPGVSFERAALAALRYLQRQHRLTPLTRSRPDLFGPLRRDDGGG